MTRYHVLLAGFLLVSGVAVYFGGPQPIHFKQFSAAEFTQQLSPLMLAALFIERSLEVFITTWRGGGEAELQRSVAKADADAKSDPTKLSDLHSAQDKLSIYKSSTQKVALPAALVIGLLVSALGIRGLGNLLDPNAFVGHPTQHAWFTVADVFLTGSVLGGGSDVVHSIITAFTGFLNPPKA